MPDINTISNNPFDRIPDKTLINDPETRFDIHCHNFNYEYIPDGYIGIRLPLTRRFMRFVEKVLHAINPFSDKDKMSYVAYFVNMVRKKTCKEIADKLLSYYDGKTVLCSLMMDMQPKKGAGIRGKVKKDYNAFIKAYNLDKDKVKNLCGLSESINHATAIISKSDGVVGVDSAYTHMGNALKKPVVGIYAGI